MSRAGCRPVIIFIEHVARELDQACLLRALGEERGGPEVEVVSLLDDLESTLRGRSAPAVFLPYFYSARDFRVRDLLALAPDAVCYNLGFEHLFFPGQEALKAPADRAAREGVIHLAASQTYRDFLLRRGVPAGHVRRTGAPGLAMLRAPLNGYFTPRDELAARHGLNSSRRWIFIPENYGAAFFDDRKIEAMVRGGFRREEALEYREFAARSLARAREAWLRLAGEEGVEVILRPRPATTHRAFRERLEEGASCLPPALHVIKEGTTRDWLLASDLVISSYSTTLIEAAWAGKVTAIQAPLPFPAFLRSPWHEHLRRIESEAELVELARDPEPSPDLGPLLAEWAGENLGSQAPFTRVWEEILEEAAREDQTGPDLRSILEARDPGGTSELDELRRLATPGEVPRPTARPDAHEADRFGFEEVERRTRRWRRLLATRSPSREA